MNNRLVPAQLLHTNDIVGCEVEAGGIVAQAFNDRLGVGLFVLLMKLDLCIHFGFTTHTDDCLLP